MAGDMAFGPKLSFARPAIAATCTTGFQGVQIYWQRNSFSLMLREKIKRTNVEHKADTVHVAQSR